MEGSKNAGEENRITPGRIAVAGKCPDKGRAQKIGDRGFRGRPGWAAGNAGALSRGVADHSDPGNLNPTRILRVRIRLSGLAGAFAVVPPKPAVIF